MLPIKHILCPTDFREPAKTAIAVATELTRSFFAELTLIHVLTPIVPVPTASTTEGLAMFDVSAYLRNQEGLARAELDKLLAELSLADLTTRVVVTTGSPAQVITDIAAESQADLIVIGTHGRTGLQRIFFGSVAEKVVRTSPCPVLTVPPTGYVDDISQEKSAK